MQDNLRVCDRHIAYPHGAGPAVIGSGERICRSVVPSSDGDLLHMC
jgi:hypothetical protein